ncbi:MAG: hypothetical protein ACRDIE_13910 [Chloroflexota bacterium]
MPFSVPAAGSYIGSSISLVNYDHSSKPPYNPDGGPFGYRSDQIFLTGSNGVERTLGLDLPIGLHVAGIASLLTPGVNVLALWENPAVDSCGPAIGVRISIKVRGVKGV